MKQNKASKQNKTAIRTFKSGIQRELTRDAVWEMLDDLEYGGEKFQLIVPQDLINEAQVLRDCEDFEGKMYAGQAQSRGTFWIIITPDGRVGFSLGDNSQQSPF